MIRAVTRYTLEISRPSSPYFERAICFVKPEYAQNDRLDLHRAAHQLIAALDDGVEEFARADAETASDETTVALRLSVRQRLRRMLPLALSAIIGAGAATLIIQLILAYR